jgi:hypothetical protein
LTADVISCPRCRSAIVPVPEAVVDDSAVDLWSKIQTGLAEAVGLTLDAAVFAGANKSGSWPQAIIPGRHRGRQHQRRRLDLGAGRERPWARTGARAPSARLESRRSLHAQLGKPVPRRVARRAAGALLQPHTVPVRVPLIEPRYC